MRPRRLSGVRRESFCCWMGAEEGRYTGGLRRETKERKLEV